MQVGHFWELYFNLSEVRLITTVLFLVHFQQQCIHPNSAQFACYSFQIEPVSLSPFHFHNLVTYALIACIHPPLSFPLVSLAVYRFFPFLWLLLTSRKEHLSPPCLPVLPSNTLSGPFGHSLVWDTSERQPSFLGSDIHTRYNRCLQSAEVCRILTLLTLEEEKICLFP